MQTGLAAARRNLIPGLVLWALGSALVAGYYLWPAARPLYERLAQWKTDGGYLASVVFCAFAGGLVPWALLCLSGRIRRGERLAQGFFLILFWVYRGVEVDAFYRLQALVWGEGTDAGTVALKAATDMLLYSACWTLPGTALVYCWALDCGRSWSRFRATVTRAWLRERIPAVIIAGWAVWTPTVCLVYSLPSALQVPIFAVVLCFWVLLVSMLAAPVPADRA